MTNQKNTKSITRPPVVIVMGHIDHGKSTLLDYIRKTNVVSTEVGGITQRISAYEVEVGDNRKITFLDTPGHEAFAAIRKSGSLVADIAIIVVSAEDGVKPQTVEAFKSAEADNIPFIVAINKIDKPGANIEKTKQSLAENGVLVEGWGGTVPVVSISAKTGEGIPLLLEILLLQADISELKGQTEKLAEGFIIESHMNPQKGVSAMLIIKNGTMKKGLFAATSSAHATVRTIESFSGKSVETAEFSAPVIITGWNNIPKVGEKFRTFESKAEAVQFAAETADNTQIPVAATEDLSKSNLPLIIKADTVGSLEAVIHQLQKISSPKITVKVLAQGIGAINEKDIKFATSSKALVLGFNVNLDMNAKTLALRNKVIANTFSIIYELSDWLKTKLDELTPEENARVTLGRAKILKNFSRNKDKQVIGGRVEDGEIKSGTDIAIFRRESEIGSGKIRGLQSQKLKIGNVTAPQEFGGLIESKIEIVPGDIIVSTSNHK